MCLICINPHEITTWGKTLSFTASNLHTCVYQIQHSDNLMAISHTVKCWPQTVFVNLTVPPT